MIEIKSKLVRGVFMSIFLLSSILTLFYGCSNKKIIRNVYFCGGQSNANEIWKSGIEDYILSQDSTAKIIWQNFPGQKMRTWYNAGIQENLSLDLKLLATCIPDYGILKGFFWFQGEGDRYSDHYLYYEDRFNGMINEYKNIYGDFIVVLSKIYSLDGLSDNIRNSLQTTADNNDNYFILDSKNYERKDSVHLSDSAAYIFGKEMSKIMLKNQ